MLLILALFQNSSCPFILTAYIFRMAIYMEGDYRLNEFIGSKMGCGFENIAIIEN